MLLFCAIFLSFFEQILSFGLHISVRKTNVTCPDINAFDCKIIVMDITQIRRYNQIHILDDDLQHVRFTKVKDWSAKNCSLIEYQPKNKNGTFNDDGYLIISMSLTSEQYYVFIEYKGLQFTIHSTKTLVYKHSLKRYYYGLFQKWFKSEPNWRRKRQIFKDRNADIMKQFPRFYNAVRWSYARNPKITSDEYKLRLLEGSWNLKKPVNVSLTYKFTGSVFRTFGVRDVYNLNLVTAWLTKQFNDIMENSGIPINWQIHCVALTDESDLNVTVVDALNQTVQLKPGDDLDAVLHYYNDDRYIERFNFVKRIYSADVTVVVRDDMAERSSLAVLGGIQQFASTIFVRKEFVFQKYEVMHAIGHMLGCGHERYPNPYRQYAPWSIEPTIFFAQSMVTENGYCGVMASPFNRKCKIAPYFSTPEKSINGKKLGEYHSFNALWLKHNRIFLSKIGDEKVVCRSLFLYYPKLIDCLLQRSAYSDKVNCSDNAPWSPQIYHKVDPGSGIFGGPKKSWIFIP